MAKERDLDVKTVARWVGGAVAGLFGLLGLAWLGATLVASRSAGHAEDAVASARRDLGKRLEGAASVRTWKARRDVAASPADPEVRLVADDGTGQAPGVGAPRALPQELASTSFRPPRLSDSGDKIERDGSLEAREREHAEAWLRNQRTLPQAHVGEPPAVVRRVVARHRVELARLRELLDEPSAFPLWDAGSELLTAIHEALLMDALVLQHDGDVAAASARVDDALRLADALTEQSPLTRRWWSSLALTATFTTMRKVEGANERWNAALAPERLRQDLAAACLERAEDLAATSRDGDAAAVLSVWNKRPSLARRMLLPLYRRRLAQSSALLASQSRDALAELRPVSEDERQALHAAHSAPPLPAPRFVRELMVGTDLADATEPWQGMDAHESGRTREALEHLLWHAEITRRVLRLREARDAHAEGWWPPAGGDGDSEDLPGVRFLRQDAEPGHVRLAARTEGSGGFPSAPEPRLVFEAAPLR